MPERGDKVIDKRRILHQEGDVIGFTYKFIDNDVSEQIDEVAVRFTKTTKTGVEWYPAEIFEGTWNEDEEAFILNVETEQPE